MQKLHGNGLPYQRPRVPRVKAVFSWQISMSHETHKGEMGKPVQIRHGPATVKQDDSCKSGYLPWTYKPVFLRGKDSVSGYSMRMDNPLLNMYRSPYARRHP